MIVEVYNKEGRIYKGSAKKLLNDTGNDKDLEKIIIGLERAKSAVFYEDDRYWRVIKK